MLSIEYLEGTPERSAEWYIWKEGGIVKPYMRKDGRFYMSLTPHDYFHSPEEALKFILDRMNESVTVKAKPNVKPELTVTKTVVFAVNRQDLETFATKVYKLTDYNFTAVEKRYDSQRAFAVSGMGTNSDTVRCIKQEKYVPVHQNGELLNLLCQEKYIEAGTYLVNVTW